MRVSAPRWPGIACGLLLLSFVVMSWISAARESATVDEPLHAVGAYVNTFDRDYRLNPEDPPVWKYWAMLPQREASLRIDRGSGEWSHLLQNTDGGPRFSIRQLYDTPGVDGAGFIRRSRIMMLLLGVALGFLIVRWSWELGSWAAAIVAAALYAFDPNFIGHAPLVKNDVALALCLCVMMYAAWKLGRRVTLPATLLAVMACGLGPATKFSGVIFLPLLALVLLIRALLPAPWPVLARTMHRGLAKLTVACSITALAALSSCAMLWAAYGFRFAPTPSPEIRLDSNAQAERASLAAHYLRTRELPPPALRAGLPRPLLVRLALSLERHHVVPQAWTYGLLYTYRYSLLRPAYLLGEHSTTGWWYYFPVAVLCKTPVATLVALLCALVIAVCQFFRRRRDLVAAHGWTLLCLALPVVLYGIFSLRSNLNLGVRHVLPILPFFYVASGVVAGRVMRRRKGRGPLIPVCVICTAVAAETLLGFPHYISYFNVFAAPRRLELLGDSNLDWGQDLPLLKRWQAAHPDERVYLAYSGSADPAYYGIRYTNLPPGYIMNAHREWPTGPGTIAVSAGMLQNFHPEPEVQQFYARLREKPPKAVLGHTIYLYDWSPLSIP